MKSPSDMASELDGKRFGNIGINRCIVGDTPYLTLFNEEDADEQVTIKADVLLELCLNAAAIVAEGSEASLVSLPPLKGNEALVLTVGTEEWPASQDELQGVLRAMQELTASTTGGPAVLVASGRTKFTVIDKASLENVTIITSTGTKPDQQEDA